MIPESRKDDGLLPAPAGPRERQPVQPATLQPVRDASRRGREGARAREALSRVSGSDRLEPPAATLSGGNQQKLLFARALLAEPAVLIADEPTRGVDVGAKRDLYELLVELAASGLGVLLVSNEIEEILGLAHRVLVMRGGRIVAELGGDDATEGAILAAAFGRQTAA